MRTTFGEVLSAATFPIGPDTTIAGLHEIANRSFPAVGLPVGA
jgi:hypothetical protein